MLKPPCLANINDASFSIEEMIPGAGQGIITIQIRAGDKKMAAICAKIARLVNLEAITMSIQTIFC